MTRNESNGRSVRNIILVPSLFLSEEVHRLSEHVHLLIDERNGVPTTVPEAISMPSGLNVTHLTCPRCRAMFVAQAPKDLRSRVALLGWCLLVVSENRPR